MRLSMYDSETTVNSYLEESYGFDISVFKYSLEIISSTQNLLLLKRRIAQYEKRICRLKNEKKRLVEHIDDFLRNTGLWQNIQVRNRPWNDKKKIQYIQEMYNLGQIDTMIEEEISSIKRQKALLEGFKIATDKKKKGIQTSTLICLVWYLMMFSDRKHSPQKFRDISELLCWFSLKKPELMNELFGVLVEINEVAIKANYVRYVANPNPNEKDFLELAESIASESTIPENYRY